MLPDLSNTTAISVSSVFMIRALASALSYIFNLYHLAVRYKRILVHIFDIHRAELLIFTVNAEG